MIDDEDIPQSHDFTINEIDAVGKEEIPIPLVKNRIFLNHVDQYNAIHITEYLTDQIMGSLKIAGAEVAGEGEEEDNAAAVPVTTSVEKYECIGTMKNSFGRQTEDILYTVLESEKKLLNRELLGCGFVIYDITMDAAEIPKALNALNIIISEIENVKALGPKTFQRYERQFVFVLISNILTWGKTKPVDPDDPDVPFTEADYRKRKACPNHADLIACEREVLLKGRKYKNNLKTYVLCCGIPYGFEEDNLLVFFKMAWENKDLPICMPGNNIIPLIHIQDVAKVIHAVLEFLPKKQYMLVVEQTPSKLSKIMRALAKSMGKGVKEIAKEEAFLYNSINQELYDMLTVNLKMEPAYILDELGLEYRNDLNLVQNMNKIVQEFRIARNLIPMKVLVYGPLFSGRTSVSNSIADYYGLHYINVGTMIDEIRQKWVEQIDAEIEARKSMGEKHLTTEEVAVEGGEEGEEEEEQRPDLAGLQEKLRSLETTLERSENNRLPDEYVIRLMRSFLASNLCQNQGYVLDAYPKTMQQTKELFGVELGQGDGAGGEYGGEEEELDDTPSGFQRSIVPQFVISLQANDEYLIEKMMDVPEKLTAGTNYEEENMIRRLKEFRENDTEDNTLLNFFDEHEIHPITINVMLMNNNLELLFEKVRDAIGPAVGFEPTREEQEEFMRCQLEADQLKAEQEAIAKELLEQEAIEDYQKKMEERIHILDELQIEEEKLLTVQCEPLRSFLMTHVFPTLTQGLLEVARIKPHDPIDYLAEYLFKYNPEGKMFDPTYTRRGELIQNETKDIFIKKSKHSKLTQLCK